MNGHCCICGKPLPRKTWREDGWLKMRADNDPTHIFCPEHNKGEGLKHATDYRAGRIGCYCATNLKNVRGTLVEAT